MTEEDYITKELTLSWDVPEQAEVMRCMDSELKKVLGVSVDEYLTIRNDMFRNSAEGRISYDELNQAFIRKAMVDLVGRGLMSVDVKIPSMEFVYGVTVKGHKAVIKAYQENWIAEDEDSMSALLYMRNNRLL